MKSKILETGESLGIRTIGVTDVTDFGYLEDMLTERQCKVHNCEFEEQDIRKRLNVKKFFNNCRSIIAVGIPYAEGYSKIDTKNKGLLSVSSFGEDYHLKLKRILTEFAEKLGEYTSFQYCLCVDTSPLIDREICKNAGIGHYGKNSMLINDKIGSFMYIGYLLTDIDLKHKEISLAGSIDNTNICGTCDICIKNCPNGAIGESSYINVKKCVSYLTQTKSYIPMQYRSNMGSQIYGCDMCQITCPQNKKILSSESSDDYNGLLLDLEELLSITNKEFASRYGHMAGSWRGKNIWKRNGIIAIANLHLTHMFDKVKDEMENPSDMIKTYAAWSMMKLDKNKASNIINNYMQYEKDIVKNEYRKILEIM